MARVDWIPPLQFAGSAFHLRSAEPSVCQLDDASLGRVAGAPAFFLAPPEGIQSASEEVGSAASMVGQNPNYQIFEGGVDGGSPPEAAVLSSSGGEEEESVEQPDSAVESSQDAGRRNKRKDLPRLPAKRRRGNKRKCLAILRSDALKALAVKKLRDDFFASSGAPSLNSKRRTVEDLAREALKLEPDDDRTLIYPLTPKLVEEVAAAM